MADAARAVFDQEPEQVKKLREQETAQTEEGHQEYYFQLLERSGKSYLQTDAPGYPGEKRRILSDFFGG